MDFQDEKTESAAKEILWSLMDDEVRNTMRKFAEIQLTALSMMEEIAKGLHNG